MATMPERARGIVRKALLKMAGALTASDQPRQRAEVDGVPWSVGGLPARGYEGASMARRLSPWVPNRQHINSILQSEGELLRSRTRQLIANTPHGANASE